MQLPPQAHPPELTPKPQSSFTSPPILSPRFSSSPSQQLYSPPSSITLSTLQELLGDTFCQTNIQPCLGALSLIPVANSLDFNYDAISHSAVASLYTAAPIGARGWRDKIFADPAGRVEVGVLNSEPRTDTMDTHEQRLGGILTVVEPDASEQKRPGAALFTVPARHHTVPGAQFSASIDQPAGLHPTLRISMQGLGGATATGALEPGCKLHAYLTLPRGVFLDRHTLTDELTLSSHNLTKLHALSGATDLEAPAYSVAQWGSAALFELSAPPADATEDAAHTATVPLHARYLRPADGGVAHVEIPAPALFFACPAEAGAKFPISPFDRAALGYDGLFGVRTLFRHVTPEAPAIDVAEGAEGAGLVSVLEVPVLDTAGALTAYIAPITIAVVAAGFAWLVWTLVRPVAGSPETDKTKSTTKGKTSTSGSGAKGKSPAKAKGN